MDEWLDAMHTYEVHMLACSMCLKERYIYIKQAECALSILGRDQSITMQCILLNSYSVLCTTSLVAVDLNE